MSGGEFAVDQQVWSQIDAQAQRPRTSAQPRFFKEQEIDKAATEEAGMNVYRDVEMVEIRTPGNRNNIPVLRVTDEHRQMWPEHYKHFKAGSEEIIVEGTPLEQWAGVSTAQVRTLKEAGIHSVDQLAVLPDNLLQALGMGWRETQRKAKTFIDIRDKNADTVAMMTKIQKQEDRISELEEKVTDLKAQNEILVQQGAVPKRGPGRPRKKG